jgi:hypothetical protein
MKEDMDEIYRLAREHGVSLAAVIYPYSSQIAQRDIAPEPQIDLVRFWTERHIPVLDTLPVYRQTTRNMFEDGVVHLSREGHKEIADELQQFLSVSGLLAQTHSDIPQPQRVAD